MNRKLRSLVVSGVIAFGCPAVLRAAETYHWSDTVDDKWSTPGNWQEGAAPTATDVIVEVNCTKGTLDLNTTDGATLSVWCLKFTGTKRTHVVGSPLKVTAWNWGGSGNEALWNSGSGAVSVDVPVSFSSKGYTYMKTNGTFDFLKPVTISSGSVLNFRTEADARPIRFRDTVVASRPLSSGSGSAAVRFYRPLVATAALQFGDWNSSPCYFGSTNSLVEVQAGYGMEVSLGCENAFTEATVITQSSSSQSTTGEGKGCVNLNNYNQVFNRLTGTTAAKGDLDRVIRSKRENASAPTVLTLKGSANANTTYGIGDMVTVVWDPTDDFTQTFTNRNHQTRGSVIVKGGTVRVAGTGTFKDLRAIDVRSGATFGLASTVANALANVRHLRIAGRLVIGADAATPFSGGVTVAKIAAGGKIAVGAGQSVTLAGVEWNGAYLADDAYSGTDWIEGEGSVVIDSAKVAIWKAATDGEWETAANWVGGAVPTAAQNAYLDVESAEGYVVSIKAATALPKQIDVCNLGGGTATLSIGAAVTHDNGRLFVGQGGEILIPSSGSLTADLASAATSTGDGTVAIEDGGAIRLTGGALAYSNFTGCFGLGGTSALTSRFEIVSGTFNFTPKAADNALVITRNSVVSWKDASVSVPAAFNAFKLQDGLFDLSGATVVTKSAGAGLILQKSGGRFALSGTASWPLEKVTQTWGDSLGGGTFEASVGGQATMMGVEYTKLNIGGALGAAAHVVFDSPAIKRDENSAYFAQTLRVGTEGTVGDVEFRSGSFRIKDYATYVGCSLFSKGTLRLTGATFINKGGSTGYSNDELLGLDVGVLLLTNTKTGRYADGLVEMSSGAVTNTEDNHLVVGAGFATGTWKQAGGDLLDGANFIIGAAHGAGTFELSGGTVTSRDNLFVGGIETNLLKSGTFGKNLVAQGWPINLHDAEGTLRIGGGQMLGHSYGGKSLTTYVGLDGRGTLEMDGSAGKLWLGKLCLTNNPAYAETTGACLSYKLDANGVSAIRCYGNVKIATGTKLKIDFSRYAGKSRRFQLLFVNDATKQSIGGAIAEENVEAVGVPENRVCVLEQSASEIVARLKSTEGSLFIVR